MDPTMCRICPFAARSLTLRRRARAWTVVVLLCLLVIGAACTTVPPLTGVQESPEALAKAVVAAFERKDTEALRRLALTEQEFRDHVWPELPSARKERNLPFSFVWGDLRQKSDAALARTLAEYGGRRLELKSVRSTGETTQYASYVVERRAELTVADETGAVMPVRLFGSILHKDGGYKVFSYVVD